MMFHIDYVAIHGMRKELSLFLLILCFIFFEEEKFNFVQII